MQKKIPILGLLVSLLVSTNYAQSTAPTVIASSGGHASNATHQLSWTIGEPIITTNGTGNHVLTQGFHQSNLSVNSIFKLNNAIDAKAYPNPTNQQINITIQNNQSAEDLTITLLDLKGVQLKQFTLPSGEQQQAINLEHYPSGVYLIRLQNSKNQTTNTFQIIKK